jgi:antitoxin component of RelBE/YafQ-DinJ toxin-antitoxin module
MNTAVLTIKTNPVLKDKVSKIAKELGFSVSSLVNAYLRHLVRTKTINFSLNDEIPSDWMIEGLAKSKKNIKEGKVSPTFTDTKSAIKWLQSE